MTYTLAEHGDSVEQQYWDRFLQDEFPSYETVWASYIVPLTGRPDFFGFKSDSELAKIGRGPEDMCNAQLHYTTFTHLVRAHQLKGEGFTIFDPFIEAVVRLAAATDVADELLERVTHRGKFTPWEEGPEARKAWREANSYPMQDLRNYRNRLLHGRLVPCVNVTQLNQIVRGVLIPTPRQIIRVPRIGVEQQYLDWREIVGRSPDDLPVGNLNDGEAVVEDAWTRTLAYLEREWSSTLAPAVASF